MVEKIEGKQTNQYNKKRYSVQQKNCSLTYIRNLLSIK